MVSRTQVALIGLFGSIVVSGILYLHFGIPAFLIVIPFVPILAGRARDRPTVRTCPNCGFQTRNPDNDYCPRDGTPLQKD